MTDQDNYEGNDGPWRPVMIDMVNQGRRLTAQAREHAERRKKNRRTGQAESSTVDHDRRGKVE